MNFKQYKLQKKNEFKIKFIKTIHNSEILNGCHKMNYYFFINKDKINQSMFIQNKKLSLNS